LIWLSNLLTTSVSDEGYSKGGLWAGKKLCLYTVMMNYAIMFDFLLQNIWIT
jgi:hypothetical protein